MVFCFGDFTGVPDPSGPRPLPSAAAVWALLAPSQVFVLCCSRNVGIPKACQSRNGSLPPSSRPLRGPGAPLAGLPILSFLEYILTNVPLLYKGLEKCYFNKLVFGVGKGGGGRETEQVDHNVVDFNIGCKITKAYNKQNIYSVLRVNVQSEFECSFLICVVGESNLVHFRVKLVE